MPYEVIADQGNQMVIATLSGLATREEYLAIREEALQLCSDLGFKRLLVDFHSLKTGYIVTSESAYNLAKAIANDERMKEVRIAHIMPKDVIARLDVQAGGSAFKIQGKNIGEFSTLAEAQEWLLASKAISQ